MWELFTLGNAPYSMDDFDTLFYKINEGYRLEKPKFATSDIYNIMLQCWNKEPDCRPLFSELEEEIDGLLSFILKKVSLFFTERLITEKIQKIKNFL